MTTKTGIGLGVFFIISMVICGYLSFKSGESAQLKLDRAEWARLAAEAPVTATHDTVWIKGPTIHVGSTKPRIVKDTVLIAQLPDVGQPTVLDTTLNGVWLGIEYETPSKMFPLGVYTGIDVSCPASPSVRDSIFVPYPVSEFVETVDWELSGVLGGVLGTLLFFAYLLIGG